MGIGMTLFEETVYDPRNGKPVNNNYADYLVAVNADIPDLDCIFLDYPDTTLNEYGRGALEKSARRAVRQLSPPPSTMPPASACANCRFASRTCC